jgi:NAD(P)H-hydrate repair Nnr-like enzyme with NAD(P)H-hydrate dehydratase domain
MEIIELAVRLHSSAADLAAQSGPIVALDVAEAVRQVISDIHGA